MKRSAKTVSAVAVVMMAICVPSLGFSQSASTGALTGSTTDATRAAVPGVAISLTNEATGEVRSAFSNESGSYAFPLLAPSSYRLEATLMGFKTSVRSGIRISVTETIRLDVQLEIGGLAETVTVESAPVDRASLETIATAAGGRYLELDRESDRTIANTIVDATRRRSAPREGEESVEDLYWRFLFAGACFMIVGLLFLREQTELWMEFGGVAISIAIVAIIVSLS